MATAEQSYDRVTNPIDLVEQLASAHDWSTDRTNDDELTLVVAGNWTDYHVSLNWRDDLEALHLACAFDFRVPAPVQRVRDLRVACCRRRGEHGAPDRGIGPRHVASHLAHLENDRVCLISHGYLHRTRAARTACE